MTDLIPWAVGKKLWWGRKKYWTDQWIGNRQGWEWTPFAELNDHILLGHGDDECFGVVDVIFRMED